MRGTSIRWSDWAVLATLAVWACLIGWEGYRRGVTVGTLTLGGTALFMFVILGSPWSLGAGPARWNVPALLVAACCFLLGWVSDLLLAMAVAWSSLLWAWLDGRLNQESNPRIFRLLILTLFVFPWVDTDLKPVSWWLRVTSAAASQAVLTQAGLPTTRDGTGLSVAGRLVEVNEQCDGRETLHAMLIVGLAAATVYLGTTRPIWPWLAPLLALAWVANTLRVLLVCLGAVWFEEERYRTWLHDWGGWLVVALMLGLCLCCFSLWNRFRARGTPPAPSADEAGTPSHSVDTAAEMGWSKLGNGELISAAEENGFSLMLTTDQNLCYQQNLSSREIGIIVLKTTSWLRIRNKIDDVIHAIDHFTEGGYVEVSI